MTDKEMSKQIEDATKPIDFKATWYREHNARGMINSILAYQCAGVLDAKQVRASEKNRWHDYLLDYEKELGEQRLLELIDEQIKSMYCVLKSVGEDSEGVIYNSVIYNDDVPRITLHKNLIALGLRKENEYVNCWGALHEEETSL